METLFTITWNTHLPPPAEIAREIIEDLEATLLEQFRLIEADLAAPNGAADDRT